MEENKKTLVENEIMDEALDDATGGESLFDGVFTCKSCGQKRQNVYMSSMPGICKRCKDRYFFDSGIVERP